MKATTKMTRWVGGMQIYSIFWIFSLMPFISQLFNTQDSKPDKAVPVSTAYVDVMSLSCKQGVNISISNTGISYAIPAFFISPNYPNFIHVVSRIDGRSDNKVTCDDVGHTLTIIVTDTLSGDQCMSQFNVEDKLPPVMICDSVFVPCGIGLDDQGLNAYAGFAVDNCTNPVALDLIDQNDTLLSCPSPYSYKSTRTYIATDASGNSSSCTFSIYFIRPVLDSIVFPHDTTMLCSEFSSDTSVTGVPTFMGYPLTSICGTWFWWDDLRFNMGCPGRYKIRRIWSVMDECAGVTRRDTQYIMSIDTISPEITCPADVTLATNMTDCQANYVFEAPVVSDNCTASGEITILRKVDGIIRSGNSINLDLGVHTIELIANDKCNNTANCSYTVTVEDHTAPNITCHDLVVGLNNLGQGTVCADSLDFEFDDNCDTSLTISVRKMQDSVFTSCVTYDCSEYGSNNMLVVQVCDSHGNCNSCMVTVDVQDKQKPVIDCSSNHLTIKCDQVADFNIWDNIPPMTDNCSIVDTLAQPFDTEIQCNEGELSWRIVAIDIAGNSDTCYFYVTVTNPYEFNDLEIDWPDDITLTGCAPNLNDTSLTGFPQILSPYCNYLWIGSSSDTTVTDEGCGIVTKTWTIIDTCRYDGDNEGIISHNQIINADVGIGPVFTHVPADTTVEDNYYCDAIVKLDTAKAKSCAVPVTIVNDYNDQGAAINDTFPAGVTIITFTATDTCGRTSTATTQITVNSEGLQIECRDTTVSCEDYDIDSIPIPILISSCGDTMLSRVVTENLSVCHSGTVTATYTVTDEKGHTATCTSTITVVNNGSLTQDEIEWPADTTLTGCSPDLNDSTLTGYPIITGEQCGPILISYTLDTVQLADGCGEVTKTWTVIDSCIYDGGSIGVFTHDQKISADVGFGPMFTHVQNDTIINNYCGENIQLDVATAGACVIPVTIVNDYNNQGAAINDTFPAGVTVITYTATDDCGRTSTATTQVTVNDRPVQIECHDYTYACDEYDIDSLPLPELISACGDTTVTRVVNENLNVCNAGVVTVTYTVTDSRGHSATCTSTITVTNDGGLTSDEIDWPDSPLTLADCNLSTHPDSINSRPIITNSSCGRDSIFWVDSEGIPSDTAACYAISRTWTIIDSCSLDSTNGGIWTFTQLINVKDTTAPVFSGYALGDTITFYVDTLCQRFVDLSGLTVADCSPVSVTNNSTASDADTLSVDASGTYKGIHPTRIDYVATDTCGNISNFHLYVKGIDTIPPTWVCPRKKTLIMNLDGIDTMYAWQLTFDSLRAHDNCTLDDSIRYSFDSTNVDNDSILVICTESVDSLKWEGLTVYAFDESGNYTSCTIAVHYVAPEGEDVDCNHMMMISGNIRNEEGVPIDDVMVTADGAGTRSRNDNRGDYYLHDIPPKSNVEVYCDKHDSPENGVSTLDIIKLRDHLLGRNMLKSPYKLLAADVNNDQKLSVKDILDIRSLLVGNTNIFPSGYEWRFADKSYRFANKENPFNQPDVYKTKITRVFKEVPQANFIGIKMGDLNNSAKVNLMEDPIEVRSEKSLPLFLHSKAEGENMIEVTISADELKNYTGMQFELQFDPQYLQFDHYSAGNLGNFDASNVGLKDIINGRIKISWDNPDIETGTEIIHLYFTQGVNKGTGTISLLSDNLRPEAYTTDGKIESILIDGTDLQINSHAVPKGVLYQNIPNPFNGSTSIKFYLSEDTYGVLQVMDMTGKVIYTQKASYQKGVNEVILSDHQLGRSGVYFYRFDSRLFSDTKKMILTQ
jgi:hypothetical protein